MEKNDNNFFTSNIFKWILVVVLEIISVVALLLLFPKPDNMNNSKAFEALIVYIIVCIVISLGIIFRINKKVGNYQQRNQYKDRQIQNQVANAAFGTYTPPDSDSDKKIERIAIVVALSIVFSPFIAPYVLGTLVHRIICKTAEKKES